MSALTSRLMLMSLTRTSLRTILSTFQFVCLENCRLTLRLYSRFEEIADEPAPAKPESKKRARDSDAMETDEPKLSKAQQKKLNKKLKAEDGKAVPAPEKKEAEKPKKDEKKKEQPKKDEKAKEVKTLDGGLKIQDHKVGTGPAAKSGNLVKVRYVGKLTNGKIFDSNTKGEPVSYPPPDCRSCC